MRGLIHPVRYMMSLMDAFGRSVSFRTLISFNAPEEFMKEVRLEGLSHLTAAVHRYGVSHILVIADWSHASLDLIQEAVGVDAPLVSLSDEFEETESFNALALVVNLSSFSDLIDGVVELGTTSDLPCLISLEPSAHSTQLLSAVDVSKIRSISSLEGLLSALTQHSTKPRSFAMEDAPVPAEGEGEEVETTLPTLAEDTSSQMDESADTPSGDVDYTGANNQFISLIAATEGCVRLFIAGDKTHCGKTTVALGIIGSIINSGVPASRVAYIKPATQCEAPDLLSRWCQERGVTYVAGTDAPLVFYKGFTRSFIEGTQGTSAEWIERIRVAVDELSVDRAFVIVDGVGFPGVGSCVGVSNAEVAKAARAPVLVVGKCGVGGAIDAYSLNASFFRSAQVPVLGAVFNRGANSGFYHWKECKKSLDLFYSDASLRDELFGIIPDTTSLDGVREQISKLSREELLVLAELNISHINKYVNIGQLLGAAAADVWNRHPSFIPSAPSSTAPLTSTNAPPPKKRQLKAASLVSSSPVLKRSRAEVEAAAKKAGACGG